MKKRTAGSRWLRCAGVCVGIGLSHAARADIAGGEEIALLALLAFAERNAPEVRLAERRRALGDAAQAGAAPMLGGNPTVEVGLGPRMTGRGPSDYDVLLSVTQPIEVAGERGLRRTAAARQGDRLHAEAAATRWSVTRAIAQTYRAAQAASARVGHAERRVGFAREVLSIAQKRAAAGDGTAIDVRVAEADLAQAQLGRVLASRELWSARVRLCELSGWPVDRPPLPTPIGGLIAPTPSLPVLLAQVGASHPAVRARRALEEEAHARVVLADRQAWPVPSLGVSFTREGSAGSPANYVVLGTLALSLPAFQRNAGARAEARAGEAIAAAERDATLVGLRARVAAAQGELALAAERLHLVGQASGALEDGLRLVRRAFEAGELSLFELGVARERLLGLENAAISARADYDAAQAALEDALGSSGGGAR